jgi:hypothetical protein
MCDVSPSTEQKQSPSIKSKRSNLKSLMFKDIGTAAITELKNIKKKILDRINGLTIVKKLKVYYYKRPDIGVLLMLMFACLFIVFAYYLKNYLFPVPSKYTKYQLNSASELAINDFTIDEVAVADLEAKGLKEFNETFTHEPYAQSNSGFQDLLITLITLPILMFFIVFVLPFLTIMYIGWFIWHYWQYVLDAAWGFFLMLYHYMDAKITGSLGCKWYIDMATGWGCHHPSFSEYFNPWKARYIDRPIYLQSLVYLEEYIAARRKYYEEPYEKYITIPWQKLKINLKYAKKIYIDRTMDIYLRKFKEKYPEQYDLPRNEFYHWLLNDKKAAASLYARRHRAAFEFDDLKDKPRF